MSTIQVANLHFETTGANRIEYTGNNVVRVRANGGFQLPFGTSAQRANGDVGLIRYNTDTGLVESFGGAGTWDALPAGPVFNVAYGVANAAFNAANAEFAFSNAIYAAVNSVFGVVNAAYTSSNADYTVTNAAFARANTSIVNSSGTITTTNLQDGLITDVKFSTIVSNRLSNNFVKKQIVNRRMIVGGGLFSISTEFFRNNNSVLCGDVYGPFTYAVPAVQTGAERRFRLYAVYSDGSQNQGEPQLVFRSFSFPSEANVVFTLQHTWGSSSAQRDAYSNEVVGTPWGSHTTIFVTGTGSVNYPMRFHYVELQTLDVFP